MAFRRPLRRRHQPGMHGKPARADLEQPVDAVTERPHHWRCRGESGTDRRRHLKIGPRNDPRGRSLEDVNLGGMVGDLGDELNRRGSCPDDRDPLAGKAAGPIPSCGVEGCPRELVGTGNLGDGGQVQRADAGHDRAGRVNAARRRRDAPAPDDLIPFHALHLAAESDVGGDSVLARAVPQVLPYFVLRREHPGPARIELERERIHVGRHVARTPGISVIPPRPAQVLALLQDHEMVVSGLLQRDRHAQAGKPGSDDDDRIAACRVHPRISSGTATALALVSAAPPAPSG